MATQVKPIVTTKSFKDSVKASYINNGWDYIGTDYDYLESDKFITLIFQKEVPDEELEVFKLKEDDIMLQKEEVVTYGVVAEIQKSEVWLIIKTVPSIMEELSRMLNNEYKTIKCLIEVIAMYTLDYRIFFDEIDYEEFLKHDMKPANPREHEELYGISFDGGLNQICYANKDYIGKVFADNLEKIEFDKAGNATIVVNLHNYGTWL